MASLEKRSGSNLVEVMADERWNRLGGVGASAVWRAKQAQSAP
jgi:hypothetical protein